MLINYDFLHAFVDVARGPTFAVAARRRHVTASAISQQMKALETQLQVTLFQKVGRRAELTDAGRQLLEQVQPEFAQMEGAIQHLQAAPLRAEGAVRIGVPGPFPKLWLRPRIPKLLERFPRLEIELVAGEAFDIEQLCLQGKIDLTFYFGFRRSSQLELAMLADEEMVAVVAPSYLQKYPAPTSIHELRHQHRFVSNSLRVLAPWWRATFGDSSVPPRRIACQTQDMEEMTFLVRQGAGISILPTYLIGDLLVSGELTLLPLQHISHAIRAGYRKSIHLAWRKRTLLPERLRVVRDALLQEAASDRRFFLTTLNSPMPQGTAGKFPPQR